ncbi:MAG: undecaprenyldiphospho-muramoylpentapeptide beta-N-acetylglucosaminyltransferase [Ruminococcaceae bacterium]|nr:undecaprenyldiphospho-muramoylpentapeptide beta-N-acetylglucosaminyltransferase [Oscillospiraceae bacterium]
MSNVYEINKSDKRIRVVFSCGGTGGHIYPAISIADCIKSKYHNAEILFVGSKRGMEKRLVEAAGYKIETIDIQGFTRKLTLSNIKTAVKAMTSVSKAKKLISKFMPDVIIGTGGYASWAAVRAGEKMGIPTLIHEQNAYPGMTTRKLAKSADKVCLSYEESKKYFTETKGEIILTGNPVSPKLYSYEYDLNRAEMGISRDKIFVLSFGGSLGASCINDNVLNTVGKLLESKPDLIYRHVAGKRDYERCVALASKFGLDKYPNFQLYEYMYDLPKQMAAADVVISRAGAITITEAAFLGKATVLIPSPNVAENHQFKNALVLEKSKAAVMIEEKNLNPSVLYDTVIELVNDGKKRASLSENIKKFASERAVENIVTEALGLVK